MPKTIEPRHHITNLTSRHHKIFVSSLFKCSLLILGIIFLSLALGIAGFRITEGYDWIDCLLNSAMLLGGMGQINPLTNTAGKLFASFFAIYGGMVIIGCTGILLGPLMHRVMHIFHADADEEKGKDKE